LARAAIALSIGCLALTTSCYTSATVNLRDFEARGLSMERFNKRDTTMQHYGRVRVAERTWAFGSCNEVAERALDALLAKGQARGGNRVVHTHFRGHWRWMQEPVCRQNLSYLLLIVPAFLPVPMSVTVYGEAVYDRGATAGAGQ
jgi:hypothetical protein